MEISVEKLEMINELQKLYPLWINKDLQSIKICSNNNMVFLEMIIYSNAEKSIINNLDFICDGDNLEKCMFLPETDIVDNAKLFFKLDKYSLMMCVEGLFTKEAENSIDKTNN
jgi:hypothetical protein